MNIEGISAFYHDSAAALLVDGHIVAEVVERALRIRGFIPGGGQAPNQSVN